MTEQELLEFYILFVDQNKRAIQRVFDRLKIKNAVSITSVYDAYSIYGEGFSNMLAAELVNPTTSGLDGDGEAGTGTGTGDENKKDGSGFSNVSTGISAILNAIGGIIGSWKGTNQSAQQQPTPDIDTNQQEKKNNTWIYVVVGIIVLVVAGLLIFKKKK